MDTGYSGKIVTELGDEKYCMSCGEYWPADLEFFGAMRSARDGLTPRCLACIQARNWQLIRRPRAVVACGAGI